METIVAVLLYLGLMQSPSDATVSSDTSVSSATNSVSVDGTPVIIDIQEF